MLKPAQLYEEELKKKILESWYDMTNMYWFGSTGIELIELPNDNYNKHCFVSLNVDHQIICTYFCQIILTQFCHIPLVHAY